jgi:hypothetical protein
LVAIEDDYRSYREVMAACIAVLRPHVEVATTGLETLEQEVARFDPQLIISSQPKSTIQSPAIAWIKVSTDEPTQPTMVWLGERRREATEPTVELLVTVIDEIEQKLAQTGDPKYYRELPDTLENRIRHADRRVLDHKRTRRQ